MGSYVHAEESKRQAKSCGWSECSSRIALCRIELYIWLKKARAWDKVCFQTDAVEELRYVPATFGGTVTGSLLPRGKGRHSHAAKAGADLFESTAGAVIPALVIQGEVNNETRFDRYRKRGHFGCARWAGDGECTVLSPLRRCSNLYPAALSTPKPRLDSPRRSAHCSVFRPERSGSHRRW